MAQRVIILKRADRKIKQVYLYLLENWNQTVADDFYKKFDSTIQVISNHPYIGQSTAKKASIRCRLITKYNCMYYRIKGNDIIILDVLDTRQDPKKNPYQ